MRIILLFIVLAICNFTFANDSIVIRHITALRIEQAPKIDGFLDEEVWQGAEIATDFTQGEPNPGEAPSQKTEVRVLYDNEAIYIGAIMYDVSADSIMRQLSNRDDEGNTDIFAVMIDTYNDDQNAYGFVVHPTGVQWDARYSATLGQDVSWDAVWKSEVRIDSTNWYVEMKIPYSAIRFSKEDVQIWGINFGRKIRRFREMDWWNTLNPEIDGLVNQFGQLDGIQGIKSPIRLAFIPYVSSYYENYTDPGAGINSDSYSLNGGMDIKYGINDAFTLDMTLIPDFGQVQSDNLVLNLSPFEVKYDERRPFFMEGTELFNLGGLFYSRRIGGTPDGYDDVEFQLDSGEIISSNPSEVQLINSTKISGRTKRNLGIGMLNAVTARTYAKVKNLNGDERSILTESLTNYNVFVLDQALKNNSSIGFINTNVTREADAMDANVTGTKLKLRNKKNSINFEAGTAVSQKYFNNPDSVDLGYKYGMNVGKIGGNLQYGVWYFAETDTYDPNDLGFLYNNNSTGAGMYLNYNVYKPYWIILKSWSGLEANYMRLYKPDKFAGFNIATNVGATFRNFMTAGMFINYRPIETHDYFEPRVWGRHYTNPTDFNLGGFFSSDYRKKFALDGNANLRTYDESGRYRLNVSLEPRFRLNDHLSFQYEIESSNFINDIGWVAIDSVDNILFGKRDLITITNELEADYIFTNRMGLSLRVRHYWSTAKYKDFFVLDNSGYLIDSDYSGSDSVGISLHNVNFNAFNIDLVYTWVFAPGSEIKIVWKNSILHRGSEIASDYFKNFEALGKLPQTNSFSIKILYYLDYLSLRRKNRNA